MDLEQVIDKYHSGLHAFAVGDLEPIKAMYARSQDVLLANPFGGSSRGWDAGFTGPRLRVIELPRWDAS